MPILALLPPANVVCEGYVFTGVCLSTGGVLHPGGFSIGGVLHPRGGSPSVGGSPSRRGSPSGQCAGGTHPTGMHSCCQFCLIKINLEYVIKTKWPTTRCHSWNGFVEFM